MMYVLPAFQTCIVKIIVNILVVKGIAINTGACKPTCSYLLSDFAYLHLTNQVVIDYEVCM